MKKAKTPPVITKISDDEFSVQRGKHSSKYFRKLERITFEMRELKVSHHIGQTYEGLGREPDSKFENGDLETRRTSTMVISAKGHVVRDRISTLDEASFFDVAEVTIQVVSETLWDKAVKRVGKKDDSGTAGFHIENSTEYTIYEEGPEKAPFLRVHLYLPESIVRPILDITAQSRSMPLQPLRLSVRALVLREEVAIMGDEHWMSHQFYVEPESKYCTAYFDSFGFSSEKMFLSNSDAKMVETFQGQQIGEILLALVSIQKLQRNALWALIALVVLSFWWH